MEERDLEFLVDRIAARVRERLAASSGRAGAAAVGEPAMGGPCSRGTQPCKDCGGCSKVAEHLAAAGADRIGGRPGVPALAASLASYIDHTLLRADATRDEILRLCDEARRYGMASVCVNPGWVRLARSALQGTPVKVVTVVGFPLGAVAATAKAFEAREAIRHGADEIDMVLNIGALRSGDVATVFEDIRRVVEAARPAPVKVILETSMLTDEQKVMGATLAKLAGAAFVKTSTGFGGGGATAEDVALLRRVVGPDIGVKASGGIRTAEDARKMIEAGATRIGASASVAIVTGQKPSSARAY